MRIPTVLAALSCALAVSPAVLANDDVAELRQQLQALKQEYEGRIKALEAGLQRAQQQAEQATVKTEQLARKSQNAAARGPVSNNHFNPAISVILDGRYANFDNDPAAYALPGFALGGEAELGEEGFSVGHTEVTISANVDDKFYGETTVAIAEHDGEIELELEEAFIQTLGLAEGFTLKAGRFYSALGYLNEQHQHAWDFADAPLVYRGLFGNQLRDDGLQLSYIAPTDLFMQFGLEALSGRAFPAGGGTDGVGAWTAFANFGGDIGASHSWQVGLNYWMADDIDGRSSGGGHGHEGEGPAETPSFSGKSRIAAVDFVYKWAPNGNPNNRNFKFQAEVFDRHEDGTVSLLDSGPPTEVTSYDGRQKGWYAQAIYQFMPQWRGGIRFDRLSSDNRGSDEAVLDEAGLHNEGHNPSRYSAMIEWLPSEFSRLRLQFNHDRSSADTDKQWFLQYTHSLGSHGAHAF